MIEIKLMYELYVKELNFKLKEILQSNIKYIPKRRSLQNILINHKDIFPVYMGNSFENVLNFTNSQDVKKLHIPLSSVYIDGKEVPFRAIKMYVQKYIMYNALIESNNRRIEKIRKETLDYATYKDIIISFNKKITDKIILDNYYFDAVPSFGAISVIRNYNENLRVNWGASTKNKKAILDKGGIPYIKADAEAEGDSYKGEKWIVHHPFLDYYFHWHTKYSAHKYNPILKDYKYSPARGKISVVSRLQEVKNDRERADKLYTRKLN